MSAMVKVLIKTVAAAPFPVEVPEQLTGAELYSIVAAHLSLEPDKIKVRPSACPLHSRLIHSSPTLISEHCQCVGSVRWLHADA
jgi:hypothetical protein